MCNNTPITWHRKKLHTILKQLQRNLYINNPLISKTYTINDAEFILGENKMYQNRIDKILIQKTATSLKITKQESILQESVYN